jgi:DNA invertase Pin-like site-specific DNA recombinase
MGRSPRLKGPAMTKRAALSLRVSTDGQTVENQRRSLTELAERRGWTVVATYSDEGVSGTKGRDKRPGLDALMKDARRRRFDIVAFWAVDRLGRSTATVTALMEELRDLGVAQYFEKEAMDTSTPHGRAMLEMAAVFGKLEHEMIVERVKAGMARAKAEQERGPRPGKKAIGRPKVGGEVEAAVLAARAQGTGILKIAKTLGVGTGTVDRIVKAAEARSPA